MSSPTHLHSEEEEDRNESSVEGTNVQKCATVEGDEESNGQEERCEICKNVYSDNIRPHCLTCKLNFCTNCLNNSVRDGALVCPYCEQQRDASNDISQSCVNTQDSQSDDTDSGPKEDNSKPKLVLYSSDQAVERHKSLGLCVQMMIPEVMNLETLIHYKSATCEVMPKRIQDIFSKIGNVALHKKLKIKEAAGKEKKGKNIVGEKGESRQHTSSSEIEEATWQLVAGSRASSMNLQETRADNTHTMTNEVKDEAVPNEKTENITSEPESCSQDQGSFSSGQTQKRKSKLALYRSDQIKEDQRDIVLEVYLKRAELLSSDTLRVFKEAACEIVQMNIHSIATEIEELVMQRDLQLKELGDPERLSEAGVPGDTQSSSNVEGKKARQKYKEAPVSEREGINNNNWHQPNTEPGTFFIVFDLPPTLVAFEKSLETDPVYAVSIIGCMTYSAKITYDHRKLHLHALELSQPPGWSRTVQYEDLLKFLVGKNITTFLDIWDGYSQGRIQIKLNNYDNVYGRNFRRLCTGELGFSYVGSRLLEVIDEGNNASEAVLGGYYEHEMDKKSIRMMKWEVKKGGFNHKGGPGSVWAGYDSKQRPASFQFGITTGQNVQCDRHAAVFGHVEKGLSLVSEAARILDIRFVKTVDCGIILPILIWQFRSMIS